MSGKVYEKKGRDEQVYGEVVSSVVNCGDPPRGTRSRGFSRVGKRRVEAVRLMIDET